MSPDERPDLSVIVVSYNTAHLLKQMFEALHVSRGSLHLQIVVVDNASSDNSVEVLRSDFPYAELIVNPINVGFGRANNQAVSRARGRYILLLNTDAFVSSDTLEKTIDFMDTHPDYGILGAKLIGRDGSVQPGCRNFPTPWNAFITSMGLQNLFPRARLVDDPSIDHTKISQCDWVPGCYYLIRRRVIQDVGLFDPRYFLYFEEVDHCQLVRRAGWKVGYYPFTTVIHVGGESARSIDEVTNVGSQIAQLQIESELLYFRKFLGIRGLLQSIVLSLLGDCIKMSNLLLRRKGAARIALVIRHSLNVLKAAFKTKLGRTPSR